jgi:hypothetical protein
MSRMIGILWIAVGAVTGSAVWSALRTLTYILEGRQPNMGPELFILFSPVLALPIVITAGILHFIMHRYFAYRHWWQWALAGVMYSSVLLGLISPWLLLVPVAINPIVLRAFLRRPA